MKYNNKTIQIQYISQKKDASKIKLDDFGGHLI